MLSTKRPRTTRTSYVILQAKAQKQFTTDARKWARKHPEKKLKRCILTDSMPDDWEKLGLSASLDGDAETLSPGINNSLSMLEFRASFNETIQAPDLVKGVMVKVFTCF